MIYVAKLRKNRLLAKNIQPTGLYIQRIDWDEPLGKWHAVDGVQPHFS